mmetsp:Transcript_2165/g.3309  ORF Transcript_2165/g.3309 Transcript_2165/m.3309 type:complete len:277 (+) Transcript_2165:61-891(+)|eukprot:CAMPEP_0195307116 /NCGR_PEP_ID=MMETSP0707-20130614/37555_1 /TAXON_ID=33640 /ORGANISM="Asterionellopsis glacialis, Strain CCMP134" /LENGTH=276 /DNA_ID=CAMNT_0040371363 /DNA_START=56 /DNA_END=886 /DNA_ORIENTATION=+
MSSNLNYKQAANVTRRTWDTETYEARAKARAEALERGGSSSASATTVTPAGTRAGEKRPLQEDEILEEEFTPAISGAAGPHKSKRAFLKSRRNKVDLESKVGSTEIVSAEAVATTSTAATTEEGSESGAVSLKDGITKTGVGWHCKVCDCFLKDSLTYLDHINGRKHQRNLGYSMRVEKSTKGQVLAKMKELEKKQEEEASINTSLAAQQTNYEDVVKAKDDEALQRKAERARKREERKKRLKEEAAEEEAEAGGLDPDMAAMMGFSGFGGGNKNT